MIAFYEDKKDRLYVRDLTDGSRQLACSAHLHYHIEVAILLQGNTVAFADTEEYHMQAGDIFISFPNQVHHFASSGLEKYYLFIIHPDLIADFSPTLTSKLPQRALIKGLGKDEDLLHLVHQICRFQQDELSPLEEMECRGYLLSFMAKLLSHLTFKEITRSKNTDTLSSIIAYCFQNYQSDLSLGILEKELHISKYYISHLFSDKLHISFNDYVNSLRISYACKHLRRSNSSITQIASLVGFASLRTFNRAFLKQMGVAPSVYRHAKNKK